MNALLVLIAVILFLETQKEHFLLPFCQPAIPHLLFFFTLLLDSTVTGLVYIHYSIFCNEGLPPVFPLLLRTLNFSRAMMKFHSLLYPLSLAPDTFPN